MHTFQIEGLDHEHTDEHGRIKVQFHWDRQGSEEIFLHGQKDNIGMN